MFFADARRSVRAQLAQRRDRWIKKRHLPKAQVTLRSNRVYILPTPACAGLVLLLVVLALLAINYENNLVYGLTFLLTGLMIVAMHHTHANLCGLQLSRCAPVSGFAGEPSRFDVELVSVDRSHRNLVLSYPGGDERAINLDRDVPKKIELSGDRPERGWFDPGYLRVESQFPLGLFRAWSWINLDQKTLIYPKPLEGGELQAMRGEGDTTDERDAGQDEFAGFADYQPGQPLKQVAWKAYARGQDLKIKEFNNSVAEGTWLSWELWPELSVEMRLSRLCYWALELDRQTVPFGLSLPNCVLEPATGDAHLKAVLTALALFEEGGA